MAHHSETMIYGYAVALVSGKWKPENVDAMRQKCLAHGNTEGECLLVEKNPSGFVRHGFKGAY